MKTLAMLSACVAMTLSAPVLAQNAATTGLENNGSPNGASPSHAKQPGESDAGAGRHKMSEGRSSATDSKPDANAMPKANGGSTP